MYRCSDRCVGHALPDAVCGRRRAIDIDADEALTKAQRGGWLTVVDKRYYQDLREQLRDQTPRDPAGNSEDLSRSAEAKSYKPAREVHCFWCQIPLEDGKDG